MIGKLRRFFVVMYAKHIYNKAVKKADKMHKLNGHRYFVMMSNDRKSLIVLCRKEFREMKRRLMFKDGIQELKFGSIYYTPTAGETEEMREVDKIARKVFFIRDILKRSIGK